jgi:hypothetical protein
MIRQRVDRISEEHHAKAADGYVERPVKIVRVDDLGVSLQEMRTQP